MKRAKLVYNRPLNAVVTAGGNDFDIVDADTGERIECLRGIVLTIPMNGIVTANAEIVIAEVEVRGQMPPVYRGREHVPRHKLVIAKTYSEAIGGD